MTGRPKLPASRRGTRMKHHLAAGIAGHRSLGIFQQEGHAGPDAALGRPRHHRDADPSRQRRLRADDRRRSRRRKRVPVDPRAQGRGPPRRRPDRRPVHPRLRRRPRRSSPDRAGRDRECRARRRAGGPHPRRAAAPGCHACHAGRCFGSNAAANWGFHYHDLIEEPKPREVITIFELDTSGEPFAKAVYNYVWTPQTDPDGIVHADHRLSRRARRSRDHQEAREHPPSVKVPARLHFGTMGLAPSEVGFRQFDPAELYRRQHRRLAHRQGRADVLSGRGPRRLLLGRRSARGARRQRTRRHRDRNLAHRRLRVRPAQEGRSRRHGAGGSHPSDAGDRRTPGRSTASPIRTISPNSAPTRRPKSPTIRASTARCATRSASCAGS